MAHPKRAGKGGRPNKLFAFFNFITTEPRYAANVYREDIHIQKSSA